MNKKRLPLRKTLVAASVTCLLAAPLLTSNINGGFAEAGFIGEAYAAQGAGSAQGGQGGMRGGQGQNKGAGGQGAAGGQGGKTGMDKVLEADDDSDSDRPDWAGGDKELNDHRGEGNPSPSDMKGDEYGDLWVYVRDAVTGLPVTVECDGGTCYQVVVCADAECTTTELFNLSTDPEAELPGGVVPVEVELGRLNLGRAPTKVIEHAEEEAMSKITLDGAILGMDPAGRITVDGVAIDSPLENLALYIAVMTGDQQVIAALEPLLAEHSALEIAAALLGGSADKTGEITSDVVFYSNVIYNLVPGGEDYVDYSAMTYDRSIYDAVVPYHYYDTDGITVLNATVNLMDYLEATQPALPAEGGITLFSTAADDALEVVELIHTQIHSSVLPGTIAP
jgi:hypothetical protein